MIVVGIHLLAQDRGPKSLYFDPPLQDMISFVIPTLNEERVIAATIDALNSQLTHRHEIIISDGGSTDRTVEIAKATADKVVVHEGAERQTISAGRNIGANAATGDFLVFLDADSVIPQPDDFFANVLRQFDDQPDLLGLTVYLRVFAEDETLGDRFIGWIRNFAVRISNNVTRRGDCAGGEFQMVRTAAFWKVGGYREDLVTCEDRDLFRRLARIGRTKSDASLSVYHSGRRAHALGWAYLIGLFIVNTISFRLRGRAVSKEWTPVR